MRTRDYRFQEDSEGWVIRFNGSQWKDGDNRCIEIFAITKEEPNPSKRLHLKSMHQARLFAEAILDHIKESL